MPVVRSWSFRALLAPDSKVLAELSPSILFDIFEILDFDMRSVWEFLGEEVPSIY